MIVSKFARSRQLAGCNSLLQQLNRNDPPKAGLWFFMDRMFISSSQVLYRSTPTLSQLNPGLSGNGPSTGASSLISDEYWPNLLFSDDTWSEIDDNGDERLNRLSNTAWDSTGSEEIPIRNFSTLRFLFDPKHRSNIVKVVSEELDLNHKQADCYVNFLRIKPVLSNYDEIRFIRERRDLLRLLKRNLRKSDIAYAFDLFSLSLRIAQYRISFLNECGFKSLKPVHILNFDKIQALSEATVKHLKLLDSDVCVVDSLLSQLPNFTYNDSSQLRESLTIQGLTLGQQYEKAISYLLKKVENSYQIWFKNSNKYLSIKRINILSNAVKDFSLVDSYSPSDIRTLFEVDPNNLAEIITQIPIHFDNNTLIILLKYPKIFHTYSPTLLSNLHHLKDDFGFTNRDIDSYPECLTIETSDLKERITNLYSIFGNSPQSRSILSLVHLDVPEISSLLKEMKDNGFPVTDLSSLYEYHNMVVKEKKFTSETVPAHLRGLNRELDVPQPIIMQTLHRHPYFRLADNHKIKETYEYVKNLEGITKEQLFIGLNLCLYDIAKINEAIKLMKERDDFEEWRNHPYFLEALIYTIEKNYSFDDVLISECQRSSIDDINDDEDR